MLLLIPHNYAWGLLPCARGACGSSRSRSRASISSFVGFGVITLSLLVTILFHFGLLYSTAWVFHTKPLRFAILTSCGFLALLGGWFRTCHGVVARAQFGAASPLAMRAFSVMRLALPLARRHSPRLACRARHLVDGLRTRLRFSMSTFACVSLSMRSRGCSHRWKRCWPKS